MIIQALENMKEGVLVGVQLIKLKLVSDVRFADD